MTSGGLVILLSMTYWGGTARPGPLFWLGVGILSAMLLGFGLLLWWLFFSPLSEEAASRSAQRKTEIHQIIAVLAALSGLMFIIGGLWDEIWHRLYGVGAAINDFLWPPHLRI
jgi:hypothetical protein